MTLKKFYLTFPTINRTRNLCLAGERIKPENVNYADYLLPFELLFKNIDLGEIPRYGKELIIS